MTMTREKWCSITGECLYWGFGAALLSAGVGLNFVTVATITIFVIYALRVAPVRCDVRTDWYRHRHRLTGCNAN